MRSDCGWVQEHLVELLDGGLAPEDQMSVEEHLGACPQCSRELQEVRGLFGALRADGYREPSPFYWTRFNAGLRARLERTRGREVALVGAGVVPRLAPIAVAACCFALGLWIGLRPSEHAPGGQAAFTVVSAPGESRTIPVVSPESKLLVEAGLDRHPVYAADTLRPNAFAPFGESPDMVLASSPRPSVAESGLGPRSPGR